MSVSGAYDESPIQEYAETLVSLDGALFGLNGQDYIARVDGEATRQPEEPRDVVGGTVTLDLGAHGGGLHTLILGGHNNRKTTTSENTFILFDDVRLDGTALEPNDPPIAVDDAYATNQDTAITIDGTDLLADDSDPDGDDSLLAITGINTGGTVGTVTDHGNGTYTYDPNGQFDSLPAGVSADDSFTYTIADPLGATGTATVTVTVDGLNDTPELVVNAGASVPIRGTTPIGASQLAFGDVDTSADGLTYTVTTAPTRGRLEFLSNPGTAITGFTQADLDAGQVIYVHDADDETDDGFTFSLSDGVATLTGRTFAITVADTGLPINATFPTDAEMFQFAANIFSGSATPGYASGTWVAAGGHSGSGAIEVRLGGIDDNPIYNMSGGWQTVFDLSADTELSLSFFYTCNMSGKYESDEYAEVRAALDDGGTTTYYGLNGNDYVAHWAGGGSEPGATVTVPLGTQTAGSYTLALGGFNNKKTDDLEVTILTFDNILLEGPDTGTPVITSPATVAVPENQSFAIDVQATDDIDSEGAGLTYSLTGGADQNRFDIDASSGLVTYSSWNDSFNFEDPHDAGDNKPLRDTGHCSRQRPEHRRPGHHDHGHRRQ